MGTLWGPLSSSLGIVRSTELPVVLPFLSHRVPATMTTRATIAKANTIKRMKIVLISSDCLLRAGSGIGGGGGGGAATKTEGTVCTVIPSAVEAAEMLKRLFESEIVTAATVETGTAMVAVMSTLAAATRTVTRDASTPARLAIKVWREAVSE